MGNLDNVKIIFYNDSSFGNLDNGGSHGGFILVLVNSVGDTSSIIRQSKRLRRVVKSNMAAEASFWAAKLYSENTGNYIGRTTNNVIPIECFTDSRQLAEAVYSISPILDRSLRIDISILREMLEKKGVKEIKWVNSNTHLAKKLTKRGANHVPSTSFRCKRKTKKNPWSTSNT